MKKTIFAVALFSAMASVSFAQTAFSVNGQTISVQAQKSIMAQLQKRGITDVKQQENIARNILAEQAVISQEAKKQKIDQIPEVRDEVEALRNRVYTTALLNKNVMNKQPTDAQLQDLYQKAKDSYNPHEVKISHILVKDEATAKDLIAKIQGGADFATLAKENSLDNATKDNGGALPMLNVRQLSVPGLAEATVSLNKGQLLAIPFKSQAGYHVIKLDDKREVPFPSEAEVKPQLVNLWKQQEAQNYVSGLMKNAKIAEVKAKGK